MPSLLALPFSPNRFEMAYTHTLYYLAQVYKNLDEYEKAARYCHITLQRQLQFDQFVPLEWAINAATLSQYYITKVMSLFRGWPLSGAASHSRHQVPQWL